jgi:hypothetical protein
VDDHGGQREAERGPYAGGQTANTAPAHSRKGRSQQPLILPALSAKSTAGRQCIACPCVPRNDANRNVGCVDSMAGPPGDRTGMERGASTITHRLDAAKRVADVPRFPAAVASTDPREAGHR